MANDKFLPTGDRIDIVLKNISRGIVGVETDIRLDDLRWLIGIWSSGARSTNDYRFPESVRRRLRRHGYIERDGELSEGGRIFLEFLAKCALFPHKTPPPGLPMPF